MKIYNDVKMLETDLTENTLLSMVGMEFFTKKQLSPICLQWKDSISEGIKYRLLKTVERVVHAEVLDHNNSDELSRISHPSK